MVCLSKAANRARHIAEYDSIIVLPRREDSRSIVCYPSWKRALSHNNANGIYISILLMFGNLQINVYLNASLALWKNTFWYRSLQSKEGASYQASPKKFIYIILRHQLTYFKLCLRFLYRWAVWFLITWTKRFAKALILIWMQSTPDIENSAWRIGSCILWKQRI